LEQTPGEVWSISSSPYNRNAFACGIQSNKDSSHSIVMMEMTGDSGLSSPRKMSTEKKKLKVKCELKAGND
jgi:hypothetical protein